MDIVLASSSPRRREILENINMKFDVVPSDIDEVFDEGDDPRVAAMSLAFMKAYDVAGRVDADSIVIGADTIVEIGGRILGKPNDRDDAREMLKLLSGKTHTVVTGISVINIKRDIKIVDCVSTEVIFEDLDLESIEKYLDTGEPFDKAGSYAIQGFGSIVVREIRGDYFNVVGLPVNKLSSILKKHLEYDIL